MRGGREASLIVRGLVESSRAAACRRVRRAIRPNPLPTTRGRLPLSDEPAGAVG